MWRRGERRHRGAGQFRERYAQEKRGAYVPPQPPHTPQDTNRTGMSTGHKWIVALLVVLVLALVGPRACGWWYQIECTSDDGRVITHTLTGRKACDKPPYTDSIFDMGSNDYWLPD